MTRKMKKTSILFLILAFILAGCETSETETLLTDEQIEQAYLKIKETADEVLLSANPIEGFEVLAEEYRSMEEVKTVEVKKDGMTVVLENGFICFWKISDFSENNLSVVQTQHLRNQKKQTTTSSTKRKFCIINQTSDNEKMNYLPPQCTELAALYNNSDWEATIIPRELATKDFFNSNLNQYDAIYILTHGSIYNNIIYLAAGDFFDSQMVKSFKEMENNGVPINGTAVMCLKEVRNGNTIIVPYKTVSSYDIQNYYNDRHFNNTFVYSTACHGLQSEHLAKAFVNNGASAFMGWNETNCMGDEAGFEVFKYLLSGRTLDESLSHILSLGYSPDSHDTEANHPVSELNYYPASASSFRLVESTQTYDKGVNINGTIWATRNVGAPGEFSSSISDPGMLYKWNSNVGWSITDPLISNPAGHEWVGSLDYIPDGQSWEDKNSPCPDGWRIPIAAEFKTLSDYGVTWHDAGSAANNPVRGAFAGPNSNMLIWDDNSLFFPTVIMRGLYGNLHPDYFNEGKGEADFWIKSGVLMQGGHTSHVYVASIGHHNSQVYMSFASAIGISSGSFVRCVKK